MANPNYYEDKNWPWTGLDLEGETRDLKTVKRAYAKKLKVTRPDDDPEGFRKLRQAFDDAKQHIQWAQYDDDYDDSPEEDSPKENPKENSLEQVVSKEQSTITELDDGNEPQSPEISFAEPELFKTPLDEDPSTHTEQTNVPKNEWDQVWEALEKTANLFNIPVNEWEEEEPKKKPWGSDKPNFDLEVWAEILDDPDLSRLDYWQSISNDLRWQFLRFLGWNYEKPHNHPYKDVPTEFAAFLAERFDWAYEDNPHHVATAQQSKFLRRAFRNAGVRMPEPETIASSQFQSQKTSAFASDSPARPPFFLRWWFILISGGLFFFARSIFS
ncbi:MAG: hypothetical protein ACPGVN_04675 [Alphaproteobacteria bacterium]